MSVSAYIVFFIAASFLGWVFESVYGILRLGRWDRRGFLFGPVCPIYGFGVIAGLLAFNRPEVMSGAFPVWAVFLLSMAGSAVLEYSVSVALEKLFGAVWWDYSDMPLNLHGRICLPASLLFGAGGVVVAYVVAPFFNAVCAEVHPVVFEILALITVAVLACDTTASVISLSDLMKKIMQMDEAVNTFADDKVQQLHSAVQQTSQEVRSSVGRAVDQTIDGGSQVLDHVRNVGEATARKVGEAVSFQQAMLGGIADRLTSREKELLGRIRRFRSDDLRERANALRQLLSEYAASIRDKDGSDER